MKYYKNLFVTGKNTQFLQKYVDIIMHYHPVTINRCYILTKYGSDVNYLTKILWAKCYSSIFHINSEKLAEC